MACRGGYFAITPEERAKLMALATGRERADYLDELYDDATFQTLDKAWYVMHRCLANYPNEDYGLDDEKDAKYGTYPLKLAVYGGQDINIDNDDGWIMRLIEPHQLPDLARAMDAIDDKAFAERYWASSSEEANIEHGEEDLEYTLAYFSEARDFFKRMNDTGRTIVFLADQ
jgi:hypothetical protein